MSADIPLDFPQAGTGDWKVASTRRQECRRYGVAWRKHSCLRVHGTFQFRVPDAGGSWWGAGKRTRTDQSSTRFCQGRRNWQLESRQHPPTRKSAPRGGWKWRQAADFHGRNRRLAFGLAHGMARFAHMSAILTQLLDR
jgi:hypothetical protein